MRHQRTLAGVASALILACSTTENLPLSRSKSLRAGVYFDTERPFGAGRLDEALAQIGEVKVG